MYATCRKKLVLTLFWKNTREEAEREGREGRREGGLKGRERKRGRRRKGWGRDGNYLANEPSLSPDMSLSNSDFI